MHYKVKHATLRLITPGYVSVGELHRELKLGAIDAYLDEDSVKINREGFWGG